MPQRVFHCGMVRLAQNQNADHQSIRHRELIIVRDGGIEMRQGHSP